MTRRIFQSFGVSSTSVKKELCLILKLGVVYKGSLIDSLLDIASINMCRSILMNFRICLITMGKKWEKLCYSTYLVGEINSS